MSEIVLIAIVLLGIIVCIIWRQKSLCSEYRRVLTVLGILFIICYIAYVCFLDIQNSKGNCPIINSLLTNAFSVFALLVLQGLTKAEKNKNLCYCRITVGGGILLLVLICYEKCSGSAGGDVLAITLLMPIIVGAGGEFIHQFLKRRFGVKDGYYTRVR